jgi:hypothetical protein
MAFVRTTRNRKNDLGAQHLLGSASEPALQCAVSPEEEREVLVSAAAYGRSDELRVWNSDLSSAAPAFRHSPTSTRRLPMCLVSAHVDPVESGLAHRAEAALHKPNEYGPSCHKWPPPARTARKLNSTASPSIPGRAKADEPAPIQ